MTPQTKPKAAPQIKPKTAMILAAGFGKRMLPLTEKTPKPLVEVAGRPMLDHILEHLKHAGVEHVILNTHHLAEKIDDHIQSWQDCFDIKTIYEPEILETGGGLRNAIVTYPELFQAPFYLLNGDTFWREGQTPLLERLAEAWNSTKADFLFALYDPGEEDAGHGAGDFFMDEESLLHFRNERPVAPYTYMGAQIVDPAALQDAEVEYFALRKIWEKAAERGTLKGLVHEGFWHHVGTPEAITLAEQRLKSYEEIRRAV